MDYLLTDEQRMLKEMVENFSRDKIKPAAQANDREKRFPTEIIKELAELRLMSVPYPEEYDGAGMDNVSYMVAMEAISRHCAATGVIVSVHSLSIDPIYRLGTEEQKKKYLPIMCRGEKLGCFCLTEAQAGSDAGAIKTRAELVGDKWVLNGAKQFITNAPEAGIAIVFAVTSSEVGKKGLSTFIVETDTPGFKVGRLEDKMGVRASSTAEVHFEDCAIPQENLLGRLNHGFRQAMSTLDEGRIGIASQALGIAKGSIEESIAYAKERVQFGRLIIELQGIRWYLAQMQTEYEAAKLLTHRAAFLRDRNKPCTKESSMAKLKASDTAVMCASKAVQIHGGYGYTQEFVPERYFRDAKVTQIYEGSNEIQREVIGKRIFS
ncbi:MAG: acyl-CoA dehydrogenase [Planctomycetes bacterium]|nr:acyl-CoA dehydrogenase [Planctomycetota bacterium]